MEGWGCCSGLVNSLMLMLLMTSFWIRIGLFRVFLTAKWNVLLLDSLEEGWCLRDLWLGLLSLVVLGIVFTCVWYDGDSSYPFLDLCFICYLAWWSTGQRGAASLAVRYRTWLCVLLCGCLSTFFVFSVYWYIYSSLRHVFYNLQIVQVLPLCWSYSKFSQLMTSSLSGTGLMKQTIAPEFT